MQQDGIMVANVMPALPPPPDPEGETKRSKFIFLELSDVAYHNKWNL